LKRLSFLFAIAIAGCSSGGSSTNLTPQAQPQAAAPASVIPQTIACPTVGKLYQSANAQSTVANEVVYPVLHTLLSWTVTFANQATTNPPVRYVPEMFTCGAASGLKPFGTVRNLGVTGLHSTCNNGICDVMVTYSVEYTPRKHLPGDTSWKYDLIRFYPKPQKKPYWGLPAFLIEIKRLPP
jgi:hypothetical protein